METMTLTGKASALIQMLTARLPTWSLCVKAGQVVLNAHLLV